MTLRLSSGRALAVGKRLAAGGQGEVYAVESPPGHVFKKYFPRELGKDPELESRLRSMVSGPPAGWREPNGHINMAWPVEAVYEGDKFAGFIMPVIDMANTVGIHRITNPSDRQRAGRARPDAWLADFSWRYLVRTAVNLVQVTHAMHASGTVIGDFNDANVRVGREARVTLLDCDSMQIRDATTDAMYLCRVGRPEYTAPELLHEDWSTTPREPSSDIFALSIHLYALLLEGEHPFRGVWDWEGEKPGVIDLAARGIWAYLEGGPLIPRPAAIGIDLLPPEIRQLFRTSFEHGSYSPEHRPGADEWYRALRQMEAGLRTCAIYSSHVYPGFHGSACPWCEHARRIAPLPPPPPAPSHQSDPPSPSPRSTPPPPPGPPPPGPPPSGTPASGTPASGPLAPARRTPARRAQPGTGVGQPFLRAHVGSTLSTPLETRPAMPLGRLLSHSTADEVPAEPGQADWPPAAKEDLVPLRRTSASWAAPALGRVIAPPPSWQEHWSGHAQLLSLHHADAHGALYFDADVDIRQARWISGFISRGWEYVRATYGDEFGPDPRLFTILHAGRYPGGRMGSYRDPSYDYRNVIDLGAGAWREADELSRDGPFREIAHLVEFASNGAYGSPAAHIWGGSGWPDIFSYDLYVALGFGDDARRCYEAFTTGHVSGFPRAGTWWFRDWFYPVWRDCGKGAVLARFLSLLARYFPQGDDRRYVRNLTWGEYIHFTSGAARGDLRGQAARAFGWSAEWDEQLDRARAEFPAITY